MSPEDSTIYVIDDDVSIRDALKNLLQSVGLKVETFNNADKFLSRTPTNGSGVPDP